MLARSRCIIAAAPEVPMTKVGTIMWIRIDLTLGQDIGSPSKAGSISPPIGRSKYLCP